MNLPASGDGISCGDRALPLAASGAAHRERHGREKNGNRQPDIVKTPDQKWSVVSTPRNDGSDRDMLLPGLPALVMGERIYNFTLLAGGMLTGGTRRNMED